MGRKGDAAIRACLVACGLGLVGAGLFKDAGFGLNFAMWSMLAIGAAAYCGWKGGELSRTTWVGLGLAGLSAVGIGWYSSPDLRVANWIAFLGGLGLAAVGLHGVRVAASSFWQLSGRMIGEPVVAYFDGITVLGKVPWKSLSENPLARKNGAVFRGVLIATPLVLLFGSLFASADAVFSKTVTDAFSVDLYDSVEWGGLWVLFTLLGLGFVGGLSVPTLRKPPMIGPPIAPPRVGMTEVSVVLCSLCAVFGLFVAIQFQYLFGGSASAAGLSYAEYARRGFFELVWVAALMLPLLVGAQSLAKQDSRRDTVVFRVLATVLTSLLFIVMASAMTRMQLYIESYGLTPLRVSSSAFMLWLALVFSWFLASMYRSAMQKFAVGALVAGYAVVLGLNFVSPDEMAAKYNVARFGSSPDLDTSHLANLGAETVPYVLANYDELSPAAQKTVLDHYGKRFGDVSDWRSESVSDMIAGARLDGFSSD